MFFFYFQENDELYKLQTQQWDPIIEWFKKRYQVDIEKTRSIASLTISQDVKTILERHLLSYNFESLIGIYILVYIIQLLKYYF